MGYQYVVLGAGRQGVALGYDLAANCEADAVILSDIESGRAQRGVERIASLLDSKNCRLEARQCDAADDDQTRELIIGADVVLSATPYRLNVALTDLAVEAGASFCDLGGNTDIVRAQLDRHDRAVAAGVSITPDCGLAPGLGNILAAYGIEQMDEPAEAHVRCGGLPTRPVGPLGYKMLFHFQGLINEYSGFGEFLREGEPTLIPALTELEQIEFPDSIGKCEAAVTSGGTSTCAASFNGKVLTYDYKTVRYPGHFAVIRALFELGCFEERVELAGGETLKPKAVLRSLMEDRLAFPDVRDLVVLRATVSGKHAGRPQTLQFDLFDQHDEATGFTAMERMTAYPTTLVAHMQARKLIEPGARPLETALPLKQYMAEAPRHGINIAVKRF